MAGPHPHTRIDPAARPAHTATMPRQKESNAELLLKASWWVSAVLGVIAFAALRWGASIVGRGRQKPPSINRRGRWHRAGHPVCGRAAN